MQATQMQLPSDQDRSGRSLGSEEITALADVITSGTLTGTKGKFVRQFEASFAQCLGLRHGIACSSGSAAIHTAIAAVDPAPGDEVVTTSITDMGALIPILYQGAIPVFADVDCDSCNVTAESIARVLSNRTKAIVVTHLFGNPCDMIPIMELADSHGLLVIEDSAQAMGATYANQPVGAIGDIGCFSFQQGKHITTGEGGLVVTNDNRLERRMRLFVNKAWGYGDEQPDHYFAAPNYRMNELTGAVGCSQLSKLPELINRRVKAAHRLNESMVGLPGIQLPTVSRLSHPSYWRYCIMVDETVICGGVNALAEALRERGIPSAPHYIHKPAFRCQVFAKQRTFGDSCWPFTLARPDAVDYAAERFSGTFTALSPNVGPAVE